MGEGSGLLRDPLEGFTTPVVPIAWPLLLWIGISPCALLPLAGQEKVMQDWRYIFMNIFTTNVGPSKGVQDPLCLYPLVP